MQFAHNTNNIFGDIIKTTQKFTEKNVITEVETNAYRYCSNAPIFVHFEYD